MKSLANTLFFAEQAAMKTDRYASYAEAQKTTSYETLAAMQATHDYEEIIAELTKKGSALLPLAYRDWFVIYFAWAIPSAEALQYISALSPIIEVGAGSGYWAHRIAAIGGEITAFDPRDWEDLARADFGSDLGEGERDDTLAEDRLVRSANRRAQKSDKDPYMPYPEPWYPIEAKHAHHVDFPPFWQTMLDTDKPYPLLFICWPGYMEKWPAKLLERYPGTDFIYVGDDSLCADDNFHATLDADWDIHTVIEIPQFMSIRDRLIHYRRKR